jgi:hypothetical protein
MMVEITYQMMLSTLQTAGLLVGIVYYITIMRNAQRSRDLTLKAQEQTHRTRESQLFMNIYNQSFANPEFIKSVKIIHQKIPEIKNADDFTRAYDYMNPNPEDPDFQDAWNYVSSVLEGIGVFVKEGLVDIRLIALTMMGMTQYTWSVVSPFVDELRASYGSIRWISEWEYLVNELEKYAIEHPELLAIEDLTEYTFMPKQPSE